MPSTLGSATFGGYEGVPEERALSGANLIFGHALEKPWGKRKDSHYLAGSIGRHLLSVAPTRSGKGVSLIIPNLLQYQASAIVIDPKGENAWVTARYRREKLGQKTFILDPWGEVNRRYGDLAGEQETLARFNPLSILDPASEHYAEDVGYLADALIINQGKEPHWDDSARELIGGLIAFAVENPGLRAKASLGLVRELLTQSPGGLRDTAQEAAEMGEDSVAARKLGRFVGDNQEIASIVSNALTQTAFLDGKALNANMAASDFSFADLIDGNATIYLVLPIDKLQTHGRWLRLMISIGIRTVARNVEPLPLPILFILDEFGTIGRLSAVAQAYGLMAGLQMLIWVFVQDLVQLRRDYPDDWETFIGNSHAVTFFNVMDQFTARYFSDMLGTQTVEQISQYTAKKREGMLGDPTYSDMADRVMARDLLQPYEVRTLPEKKGIMLGRADPLMFQKIVYHEEDTFWLRARADPRYPITREEVQARKARYIARLIPDEATAAAELQKRGYQVKRTSKMLGADKYEVVSQNKTQKTMDATHFVDWVRTELAGSLF